MVIYKFQKRYFVFYVITTVNYLVILYIFPTALKSFRLHKLLSKITVVNEINLFLCIFNTRLMVALDKIFIICKKLNKNFKIDVFTC